MYIHISSGINLGQPSTAFLSRPWLRGFWPWSRLPVSPWSSWRWWHLSVSRLLICLAFSKPRILFPVLLVSATCCCPPCSPLSLAVVYTELYTTQVHSTKSMPLSLDHEASASLLACPRRHGSPTASTRIRTSQRRQKQIYRYYG